MKNKVHPTTSYAHYEKSTTYTESKQFHLEKLPLRLHLHNQSTSLHYS